MKEWIKVVLVIISHHVNAFIHHICKYIVMSVFSAYYANEINISIKSQIYMWQVDLIVQYLVSYVIK